MEIETFCKKLKYPNSKPERFRIVKLSETDFRVDYLLKFLGIPIKWDTKLDIFKVYGGVDDGYQTQTDTFILSTLGDAIKYIKLSTQPKEKTESRNLPKIVYANGKVLNE